MKGVELIKYLAELAHQHSKKVFRLRELSIFAKTGVEATAMCLLRLKKKGIVDRVGSLWMNLLDPPALEEVALTLCSPSYISFENALFKRNVLSQSPRGLLSLVTTKRSGRYETPMGNIESVHMKPQLFFGYDKTRVAHPEKALLDMIYIRTKKGLDPLPPVTLYWEEFNRSRLKQWGKKFPPFVLKFIKGNTP